MTRTGLTLEVLRGAHGKDCTLGGVSSKHETLTLMGIVKYRTSDPKRIVHSLPAEARSSEPREDAPPVALEVRLFYHGPVPTLVPTWYDAESGHWLINPGSTIVGGNFAYGHDARFRAVMREALGYEFYGAVSVHDRKETYDWQP
ncbi:hypothetical protein ACFVWR_06970 [Leifsonia sp. NPDC058292]|uniref:hypothetical protein n=1 Tax=Leifsonia sp. NPDC058292 TaxID=3346428 RepID=UPI0036DA2C4B